VIENPVVPSARSGTRPLQFGSSPKQTAGKEEYGSRTCKPNSVRRIAPAGRSFLWATHRCEALATYPKVGRTEPARVRNRSFELPSYLVLLRVWFALPAALLRRRCALTAPFHPYLRPKTQAVYFLWHFPSNGLEPALPDVIRHTALWSSDFPLPASPPFPVKTQKATVRSSCQLNDYMAWLPPRDHMIAAWGNRPTTKCV